MCCIDTLFNIKGGSKNDFLSGAVVLLSTSNGKLTEMLGRKARSLKK